MTDETAQEKNREDTLRYTYQLLRRLESQEGRVGMRCPICEAPDEAFEGAPEIDHHPGCEMKAVLDRWQGWFDEAERGLTLLQDLWGRAVLIPEREGEEWTMRR